MGSEPQYAKYPDLSLAQDIFTLTNPSSTQPLRQTALKKLQDAITEHKMAPLYRHLAHPTEGILNAAGEGSSARPSGGSRTANAVSRIVASTTAAPAVDFPWDESLYEKLKAENDEELEAFRKEEEEAAEKAGDTEVQAAKGKRADFWARVCDKVRNLGRASFSNRAKTVFRDRRKRYSPMRPSLRRPACWDLRLTSSSPSSVSDSSSPTRSW
jgi:26S proteasome regulatory subunit N7